MEKSLEIVENSEKLNLIKAYPVENFLCRKGLTNKKSGVYIKTRKLKRRAAMEKILEEVAKELETLWNENYYKPYKFSKIEKRIEELNKKLAPHKIKVEAKPKAISCHITYWHGWRRARDGFIQYCVPWYGGYVYAFVFKRAED